MNDDVMSNGLFPKFNVCIKIKMGKLFSKRLSNNNDTTNDDDNHIMSLIEEKIRQLRQDDFQTLANTIKTERDDELKQLRSELATEKELRQGVESENRKLVANALKETETDVKSIINSTIISEYVDEILKDENINIAYLPDSVESAIYKNVIRLILIIIDKVGSTAALDIFGHKVHMVVAPQ